LFFCYLGSIFSYLEKRQLFFYEFLLSKQPFSMQNILLNNILNIIRKFK